jgi:hypothetical protein
MALFPEEISSAPPLCIAQLIGRLMNRLRDRVRSGEITERGIARETGLSQPHVHNLLKGIRAPSPESADLLMRALQGGLLALIGPEDIPDISGPVARVELLRGVAAPGLPWVDGLDDAGMLVPCTMIVEAPDPTAVRLGADSAMDIAGGTVILDRSEKSRHATDAEGTYLVVVSGVGLLRYLRTGRRSVYLVTKADLNRPAAWQAIAEPRCPDLVRGRVIGQPV